MNAAVLPEPVTALPTMSLPSNATGMVADWIGVGFVMFYRARVQKRNHPGSPSDKDSGINSYGSKEKVFMDWPSVLITM